MTGTDGQLGHAGRGEDLAEVVTRGLEEDRLVLFRHAHQVGEHVQAFTLADRHVTCQLLDVGAGVHSQAYARSYGTVLLAAECAR